jgi:hypothetical protein
MAELADMLQVAQSALAVAGALMTFVGSSRRGRALAEDVGFGFMGGAVAGSAGPLLTAVLR